MERLRRLLLPLGTNAVPLGGVFLAGWSGATALSLYWWESMIGSLLVLLRLLLHRRLTRKRGYERLQLGLNQETTAAKPGEKGPALKRKLDRPGSFVAEFATAACAATVIHGLVLAFTLSSLLASHPDRPALVRAVWMVAAIQAAFFLVDLPGLSRRPFAWAREQAQAATNRVLLLHLVLLAGFFLSVRNTGNAWFAPFAVLKLLADIGNALGRLGFDANPPEAPAWLAATVNRLRPEAGDFADHWREERQQERALAERDEEVSTGERRQRAARRSKAR